MTNPELRRALDDAVFCAENLANEPGDIHDRALPNTKAVLRFAARLHQERWWAAIIDEVWGDGGDGGSKEAKRLERTYHSDNIAASPEWRAAWEQETGIKYEEIV